MKQNRWMFSIVTGLISLATLGRERPPEILRYYEEWVGCKAPTIQFDQSDRRQYAEPSYRGKRVLLYSFDAGNFCDSPDMPSLLSEMNALYRVRRESVEPLFVIGYTRGVMWSPLAAGIPLPKDVDEVSRFPVVNLNNKRGSAALGEPYELLAAGPSAILIGTNGLICKVFAHAMKEADFRVACAAPSWHEPKKDPPTETSAQVWERIPKQEVVVARRDLTAGTVLSHKHLDIDAVATSILPPLYIPSGAYSNLLGKSLTRASSLGQPLTTDSIGSTNRVQHEVKQGHVGP